MSPWAIDILHVPSSVKEEMKFLVHLFYMQAQIARLACSTKSSSNKLARAYAIGRRPSARSFSLQVQHYFA